MNFYRIEHINKRCQNLETTLRFYQTLFPDWFIRAKEQSDAPSWLHFGDRQFYFSLYEYADESNAVPTHTGNIDHVGLVIEDGEKMINVLDANNMEYMVENAPETKYRIYVKDPDGTFLELVEYQPDYVLR